MTFPRKKLFRAMAAADGGSTIRPVMVLRPLADNAAVYELIIYGDIGESWWGDSITALSIVQQLQALDASVTQINVRVNSFGGSVSDGLAIYNALRRHKARKVGTVDGVAMSIASFIVMACDELQMPATSLMMIHAPWCDAVGNAQDMRMAADVLDTYAEAMVSAYATKSGKTSEEVRQLLSDGEDHYYTGEQAVAEGFADALIADTREDDTDEAAQALAAQRVAGLERFTAAAPEHIRHAARAAVGRQPKGLPSSAKPRIRAASGFDLASIQTALGTAEGQQALVGALTTAMTAESGESDMTRRLRTFFATYRAPEGGEGGGGSNPAPPTNSPDTGAIMAQVRQRNTDIQAVFEPHLGRTGVQALMTTALADPTQTLDQVRATLLNHLGASASPVGNRVELVADETDKWRAAGQNAILARAGRAQADGQNPMRGMQLREIARAALVRSGQSTDGKDVREIVAAAFTSTSDFPALLTSTARASLLRGYDESPEVFDQFTRTGSLTDFRPVSRVGLGFFSDLDRVDEAREYKYGTFGSMGQSIVLATYGKLFAITRQAIINDDLSAFTEVPAKMGRAAKRTIGDLVFAVLSKNLALADGKPLFHAEHGNLVTPGSTISTAAVSAMRVKMGTQKVEKRPVSIPLKYLLVPLALEDQANLVRNAEFEIGTEAASVRPNTQRNRFEVISDARLDAASPSAWFGAADPNLFDTIEVAYLDGVQQPFLDQKDGWGVDGTEFKVRIDAGVAPLDFRGLSMNAGA